MRTLLTLFAMCITVSAQDTAEFLYCKTVEEAMTVIAQIDAEMGYPNPATKTITAVAPIVNKDGTCIIRSSIGAVWSPKAKAPVSIAPVMQSKLTAAQWGTKPTAKAEAIDSKATIARITEEKAVELGFFSESEKLLETKAEQ